MNNHALNGNGSSSTHEQLKSRILAQLRESLAPPTCGERLWISFLLAGVLAGLGAFVWQLLNGLKVTAMREYVSWGVYMTNFVFFIGVSHAGTLISAILRVTGAEWRRSITRMAEAITVFALMVGAPMVIIDMGRPDRILNVVLHGRLNSPILWDVCSICTYLCGSILYLYVAMLPDLALLAPAVPTWEKVTLRQRFYRLLALGYRGTPRHRERLERALATMAVIIIPVAVSVHTVVSWIFGMTLRPGWHSTIFGPYFVIGAIFSGTAAIITAMALFRKIYHLEPFLTERQFANLGRLMLALNLLYIYFTLAEYLTSWYGSEEADQRLIGLLMGNSPYGLMFWGWAVFCLFLPAAIMLLPMKKSLITRLVVASILINIGMWLKRYLIIVPTLMTPYIPPESAGVNPVYLPTWVEWTVTGGGLCLFMLLFTLFAKIFPIISIWETVEGVAQIGAKGIGVDIEMPSESPSRASRPRISRPVLSWSARSVVALTFLSSTCFGLQSTASEPHPRITLRSSGNSGEQQRLVAEVQLEGKPLAGVQIGFYATRLFGQLPLGTNITSDQGIASLRMPRGLPAGPDEELRVRAEIVEPAQYASCKAILALKDLEGSPPRRQSFTRALWSPHAPVALVLTIVTLLLIVWSTYTFVIAQLVQICKDPGTNDERPRF